MQEDNMENNNQNSEQEKSARADREVIKEAHRHCRSKGRKISLGSLFLGISLIFIGLIYFAEIAGWIDVNINIGWWQFWPIFIILIGFSLISGRGWVFTIFGIVVALIVLGIIAFLIFSNANFDVLNGNLYEDNISINKSADIKSAIINIKIGAADFKIKGGSGDLVAGSFKSNFMRLVTLTEVEDNIQKITLKGEDGSWAVFGTKKASLDLQINPDTPINFNIETGAINMDLDLSDVMAENIDIDTGASSLNLILGDKLAESKVNITAGVSSVYIILPRTIGARVNISSALSSKDLTDFRQIDSKIYESGNYNSSKKKIDINVDLGVSSLKIDWK